MGALKGRFQCLRGLRVDINSNLDHAKALQWITVAIILHNLVIEVEGRASGVQFLGDHGHNEELDGHGERVEWQGADDDDSEAKRRHLVTELIAHHSY